jgi:hypothetical protein
LLRFATGKETCKLTQTADAIGSEQRTLNAHAASALRVISDGKK